MQKTDFSSTDTASARFCQVPYAWASGIHNSNTDLCWCFLSQINTREFIDIYVAESWNESVISWFSNIVSATNHLVFNVWRKPCSLLVSLSRPVLFDLNQLSLIFMQRKG